MLLVLCFGNTVSSKLETYGVLVKEGMVVVVRWVF